MKHRILFFLALMLTATSWLAAQHAVWWGGSPPPDGTTRDHSVSYGNGFAWLVALGTSGSEDFCFDAIAVSSGGFLVVGKNVYFSGYTVIKSELVLYRLTEEGELLWEKGYGIEDYKELSDFAVIEKPHGGFFIAGMVAPPQKGILIEADADGDTLSMVSWARPPNGFISELRMSRSTYDDSFFLSYRQIENGIYTTEMFKLSYNLDTLAYTVFPNYHGIEYAPKPFGYIHKGRYYDGMLFYNLINFQGEPIDSFPDPIGINGNYYTHPVRFQSLRNGKNIFFRKHPELHAVFVTAIANDGGELLYGEPFHNQTWWLKGVGAPNRPLYEFSDGSICLPIPVHSEWDDKYDIGLVKLNSMGQLLGDTLIFRMGSNLKLARVLEGADGRPIIFGTTENGPFGGTLSGEDIFIAKLESWNPVGIPTVETITQPL
ncbi:MAG: hypothetical protein PHW91_11655, partial [Bacteroidales bacterium]|nr:hypothetical protein [Bacteroidales bacterium]